jgi:SAM-dependent methyltransferase
MYELVCNLGRENLVLDLGAGAGSFNYGATQAQVIALDACYPLRCQSDAGRIIGVSQAIPIKTGSVDVVISNHTLEHFENLSAALLEIDRILKPGGHLWAAVPDGSAFDDRLYRYLFAGGGHVNRFTLQSLIETVESQTHLRAAKYKKLYSGFVYLNPPASEKLVHYPYPARHLDKVPPRVLEFLLRWFNYLVRMADGMLGASLSLYGWGIVFRRSGETSNPARTEVKRVPRMPADTNVCFACGSGHQESVLLPILKAFLFFKFYNCPCCGKKNLFSRALE